MIMQSFYQVVWFSDHHSDVPMSPTQCAKEAHNLKLSVVCQ